MLRRRDEGVNKIEFVDIDAPEYDPAKNAGISYEQVGMAIIPQRVRHAERSPFAQKHECPAQASSEQMPWLLLIAHVLQGMANIHAILPDGRVVTNVEVFRCCPLYIKRRTQ